MILAFQQHEWSHRRALQVLHFREAFWDANEVLLEYSHAFRESLRKLSADVDATKLVPYPQAPVASSQVHTAHLFARNRLPMALRQTTESYFLVQEVNTLYHYVPAWLYAAVAPAAGASNWTRMNFPAPLTWGESALSAPRPELLLFFHSQSPVYAPPRSEDHRFATVRLGDLLDGSLSARTHAPGPLFNWSAP